MNENIKIDVRGSVSDAVSETTTELFGFLIVLAFFGCLVAPIFAPLFEGRLHEKYETSTHYDRFPLVEREMLKVKLWLLLVAVAAWIFAAICIAINS